MYSAEYIVYDVKPTLGVSSLWTVFFPTRRQLCTCHNIVIYEIN